MENAVFSSNIFPHRNPIGENEKVAFGNELFKTVHIRILKRIVRWKCTPHFDFPKPFVILKL